MTNAWVNSRSNHPHREHTREFDLIGYDSANARVPGHNYRRLMHRTPGVILSVIKLNF
jgi:hypothetical protein